MDLNAILALVQGHPFLAIGLLAFYLYETGRLGPSVQSIISLFVTGFKPQPVPGPTPSPTPVDPVGVLIQHLVGLLVQSQAAGDKELEQAALKVLTATTKS